MELIKSHSNVEFCILDCNKQYRGEFGQICSIPEPKRPSKNIPFRVQNSTLLSFHSLSTCDENTFDQLMIMPKIRGLDL